MKPLDVLGTGKKPKQSATPRLSVLLTFLVALCSLIIGFGLGQTMPSRDVTDPLGPTSSQALVKLPIVPSRMKRVSKFVESAQESCLIAGMDDTSTERRAALSNLFRIMVMSDLGKNLLQTAQGRKVLVCFDRQTDLMAYYRAGVRLIGLKPDLKPGNLVAYLAHELSHVPQHSIYSDNRYFSAADLILLRRMREAAAEAFSTRVAWQLRQVGYTAAWDLKRRDPFYGDIVQAFERTVQQEQAPNREIQAARHAFDAWFMRPVRLDLYDRMTITHLNRISGDPMGLVPTRRRLSHRFLVGLTRMEDGQFVTASSRLALTDPFYSGNLSSDNRTRLREILKATDGIEAAAEVSDAAISSDLSANSSDEFSDEGVGPPTDHRLVVP